MIHSPTAFGTATRPARLFGQNSDRSEGFVPNGNAGSTRKPESHRRLCSARRLKADVILSHATENTRTVQLVKNGQTVVLVTSGNPTFETDGPRKQLMSMLNAFEKRLRDKARSGDRQ